MIHICPILQRTIIISEKICSHENECKNRDDCPFSNALILKYTKERRNMSSSYNIQNASEK